jgi:hypothetical protein
MAWGKGKTEKGQGGKLGHSTRDGWGYHDEEKLKSKKQRRLEQKQLIHTETSIIEENLKKYVDILIQDLDNSKLIYEIHVFDSGAVMIDIRINNEFYCIQMVENKFGWSKMDEDTGFSTVPDSGYLDWNNFKKQFDETIKSYT